MSDEKMRAEFEAWYSDGGKHPRAVSKSEMGGYESAVAAIAWSTWFAAWQASRTAQSEADAVKRVEPVAVRWEYLGGVGEWEIAHNPNQWRAMGFEVRALGVITDAPAAPAQSEAKPVAWPAQYYVDGKSATVEEHAAYLKKRLDTLESRTVPPTKLYGSQDEDGEMHELRCTYVDGWNACRKAVMDLTSPEITNNEPCYAPSCHMWDGTQQCTCESATPAPVKPAESGDEKPVVSQELFDAASRVIKDIEDACRDAGCEAGDFMSDFIRRTAKNLSAMTRMFHAAGADLGLISEALGLDPDDGGAEPILAAIEELKTTRPAPIGAGDAEISDDEIIEICEVGGYPLDPEQIETVAAVVKAFLVKRGEA